MLLHEFTAIWDVAYTVSQRKVPAREQHTHSFMETIPFDICAALACLHPGQFRAMLGIRTEKARRSPVSQKASASNTAHRRVFGATGAFVALPHLEELWRCQRAKQQGLTGLDTPECARERYAS
jgi:hypothetical protein